jgi:hypothetical protein
MSEQREQEDLHPLDVCPDCGRPMDLVLEVLGGPEDHGGGAFRFCEGCLELYARWRAPAAATSTT